MIYTFIEYEQFLCKINVYTQNETDLILNFKA